MRRLTLAIVCAVVFGAVDAPRTAADGKGSWHFERISTFANYTNGAIDEPTVAEIVAASADGRTLVYTDANRGTVGFIDIAQPARPRPAGTLALDPDPTDAVTYSPTSVGVLRNQYVLVAVDTSASKAAPSGELVVADLHSRAILARLDLGGQPDSIAVSPDHRFVAIAIENERDEALPMPQAPAGYLSVVRTAGPPSAWVRQDVSLTGLAAVFPEDPEPEFVDVDRRNRAVVTLQENNHIVVVDLESLGVLTHFSAGTVTLSQFDRVRAASGVPNTISLVDGATDVRREPDAVAWMGDRIATANEGDLQGGSRGFSIFDLDGGVAYDSGNAFEHLAVRAGHYPDRRSNSKGSEPETVAAARYGPLDLLFVASERGSFVAVYRLDRRGAPQLAQLLPAPLAPEGLLAIPHRNLLVTSGESDAPPYGVRSTVQIYELRPGAPKYPQIVSDDESVGGAAPTPIPWSALSGMTEVPGDTRSVQAVWDSFFTPTRVFTIDVTRTPAVVTGALTVARPATSAFYDPEGLAYAPDGSLWIASEGNASDSRPNRLIKVNPRTGAVEAEVGLPAEVVACRAAEVAKPAPNGAGTLGSGFEGLDIEPRADGGYSIHVAQQRGWNYTTSDACARLDDDPNDGGLGGGSAAEPAWTRIWIYDPQTGAWSHVPYELAPKPANAAWVGLSEITRVDDGWIVIERDNLTGDFGVFKTLAWLPPSPGADNVITRSEKRVYDLRPRLGATRGWITDKPEGVAVLPDGRLFVVTDNDGVDGWSGETWFLRLGPYWRLFE